MINEHEFGERRRREPSEGVKVSRDAVRLVRPFNDKIGNWQAESVRLAASVRRMRECGRHDPGIVEAVRSLLGFVEEQKRIFEAHVGTQDTAVATHSRVGDTRRALQMITDRLRASL